MNTVEFKLLGDIHIVVYKTAGGDRIFRVLVEDDNLADVGDVIEEMLNKY